MKYNEGKEMKYNEKECEACGCNPCNYIASSEIKGYGELQGDDLLHNYTAAKSTENIDWESVSETIEHIPRNTFLLVPTTVDKSPIQKENDYV